MSRAPPNPEDPPAGGADPGPIEEHRVRIPVRGGSVQGDLALPHGALGTVLFAHGSGSGRKSPRNQSVAAELRRAGIATLLLDLLTPEEAEVDAQTGRYRFDVPRLAHRVVDAIDLLARLRETNGQPVGLYGASTGGAAALVAAASRPDPVRAVVLRGARSDLAEEVVGRVRAPTLILVWERDLVIRKLGEATYAALPGPKEMVVVAGATHLFEETGALEEVSQRARDWFLRYLPEAR